MRGRAVSLLLPLFSFLLSPWVTQAQCTWTPRLSIPFRTTALDVSVDGPYVWLATGYGVQLLQNEGTHVTGSIALPGSTRVVRSDGRGTAYAGSGSRLYVLRGGASGVSVVRNVDAGATINDILISGTYLFVATANGLVHFDIIDPLNPVRLGTLLTSSANVTSVAVAGGKLYAADGDATLEVFNISIPSAPQHTNELATVPRATAVHAAPDGTLYVSDVVGLNTDVFTGGTVRTARLPAGTNAFAAAPNNVHFSAGLERTVRAIDFSSTSTVKERFEYQLAPTGGTDNVIHAMTRAGNKLYVAAGDIGLAVFDTASMTPPYPIVAYRSGATNSVAMAGDRAWLADAAGTILEQKIDTAGIALTTERTWPGSAGTVVQDVEGTALLTSNGTKATLWSLTPSTPTASDSTFPAAIRTAAIVDGSTIVALLQDGTVWAGNQQVVLPKITAMARSGANLVFTELTADGKTVLHRYGSQQTLTVNGTAIGGVAVRGNFAAVFTFLGVTLVNLDTGNASVLPDSSRVIPRQLVIGDDGNVLVLDKRALYVYSLRGLQREQVLPADAVAVAAGSGVAVLATSEGTMAARYLGQQPSPDIPFASSFYTKVVTGGDRLYLVAGDTIDIFSDATRFEKNLRVPGLVDAAATSDALFTLGATGTVTAYSAQGAQSAQITLDEGNDAQFSAIDTAGNAVWVSLTRGCLTGACQKKTLVLDPASLAITATMTGAVSDVVTSGTRAYVLTELPAEIRVLNIADPLHPAQLIAAAAPESATSLAAYSGRVYVAGDRLYEYTESTLLLKATHLPAVTPDKAQQVRVDGSCLVITARGASPEAYDAATLAPATTFEVPSTVRMMTVQNGKLVLLTSHSIEVWSTAAAEPRKRRPS